MNRKATMGLAAGVLLLIAAGAATHHAWQEGWIPTRILPAHPRAPLPENFLAALKADTSVTRSLKPACLRLRLNSMRNLDRMGRAGMKYEPFPGWDVIAIAQVPGSGVERLDLLVPALDALSEATLYSASDSEATDEAGGHFKVKNYSLTLAGWQGMNEERCLNVGSPSVSEILEFSRVLSDTGSGDLYEIKAAYRVANVAPWALDKSVRRIASQEELKALPRPVNITARLRRTQTGWSVEPMQPDFPALGEEEILELVTSSRNRKSPQACIRLPSAHPEVGVNIQPAPYTITFYDRETQEDHRLPMSSRLMWRARLARLAGAGVFQIEAVPADKPGNNPAGTRYVLNPDYQQWLDINDGQCLKMGKVSPELLDLATTSDPTTDGRGLRLVRGSAKLLLRLDQDAWVRKLDLPLPEVEAVKFADGVPAIAYLMWSNRSEEQEWQFLHLLTPSSEPTPSPEHIAEAHRRTLAAQQMAVERENTAARGAPQASSASAISLSVGAGGDVLWRPAHRGNGGGISNAGLTAGYCCAGASSAALSTRGVTSGKVYAEFTLKARPQGKTADTYTTIGVLPGSALDTSGDLFILDPRAATMAFARSREIADNDIIGLAIDLDRGELHISRNGEWLSSSPSGGGGLALKPGRPQYVAAVISASSASAGTDRWTANFGKTRFRYPMPAGYSSYDGRQRHQGNRGAPAG